MKYGYGTDNLIEKSSIYVRYHFDLDEQLMLIQDSKMSQEGPKFRREGPLFQ
jgi:hypothetical protein